MPWDVSRLRPDELDALLAACPKPTPTVDAEDSPLLRAVAEHQAHQRAAATDA